MPYFKEPTKITYSEIDTLNRCERLWDYSYRRGYAPIYKDERLTTGTIMHALMAALYRGEDWHEKWAACRAEALDGTVLDEEAAKVEDDFETYATVMRRYKITNWQAQVVSVEKQYTVPLTETHSLVIHPDLVVIEDGQAWVWDHKFVRNFDRDMELRTDFDTQLSFYVWGLRRSGLEALIGAPIVGARHNYVRMRVPAIPKINKDGTMSKVRIITDEETVRTFVAQSGVKHDPAELEVFIERLLPDAFFRRTEAVRTPEELEAMSQEILLKTLRRDQLEATSMLVTRTLMRDCVRCPFLRPCLAGLKGGDEEAILAEFYRPRTAADDIAPLLPIDYEEEQNHAD